MPRIVRIHEIGGPEKLRFEDVPQQAPAAGEVRLRVQAAGLNRVAVEMAAADDEDLDPIRSWILSRKPTRKEEL